MNSVFKYISTLLCGAVTVFGAAGLYAQERRGADSIIKTQEFNVYQIYVPEIQKKIKERLSPELPQYDTDNLVYNYVVPEQKLSYSYQAVPIRPLALGLSSDERLFDNYVKAGLGNYSSILLDAGISTLQAKNFQSVIHGSHLSQKGGGIDNRQNSNTALSAIGYYQRKDHDIVASLNFNRRGIAYYGKDEKDTSVTLPLDSVRQVYWGVKGEVGLENADDNAFSYKPKIALGYYADRFDVNEFSVHFQAPLSYQIDTHLTLGLNIDANLNSYSVSGVSQGNNLAFVNPYVDFKALNSAFHVGIKPMLGKNGKFYLMPDIHAKIPLIASSLLLHGGVKGDVIQNTFQQLSTKNPFMFHQFALRQTSQLRVFGGADAKIGKHLSLGASIAWNNWKNLAIFMNDYVLTPDGRYFSIGYDDRVTAITLDAYFKYQINEVFGVIGTGAWTNFTQTENFEKVFHEPQVKISGALLAKPVKDLNIGLKLDFWDRIYYRNQQMRAEKLPAFVDVSLQGEYQVIPRLSVFLQLNNILNSQYTRWNQYQVYGFNVIGGLRFKF